MWIEIEPGEMLMLRIGLCFAPQHPEPEDAWVKDYLAENGVEPRRQITLEREGEPIEILQFGQCYLDRHVPALRDLRRRGIERSAIQWAIPVILADAGHPLTDIGIDPEDAAGQAFIARVAERVHPEATFEPGEEERIRVGLEPAVILAAVAAERHAASA